MLTRKTVETKTPNPKRGIRECKSKYFNLKLTLGSPSGARVNYENSLYSKSIDSRRKSSKGVFRFKRPDECSRPFST
jgi:hypothetical protein